MSVLKRPLKVFLCHASTDKPKVRELYRYLHRRGVNPWFDEEHLVGGQDWQLEIPKALATSDAIIICLTKNSVDKEGYIQKEIKFALDKALEMPEGKIFLIPVKFEECEVPFSLSRYQWVDLTIEAGYPKMMKALKFRASQLERTTVELPKNAVEEENLALEKAAREKAKLETDEKATQEKKTHEAAQNNAREKAERETAEKALRQKSELEAAEMFAREKAMRESAEKAAREKAKHEAAEKVKQEKVEYQVVRRDWLANKRAKFSGRLKSAFTSPFPFFRILGILGVFVILLWGGSFVVPKLISLMPTAEAGATLQINATMSFISTAIAPTKVPNTSVTSTKTVTPILTSSPTVQPTPLGGGVLVFANGVLGKQDLYAIQGDGLGLTRITTESSYIGYCWSGCNKGTKRISGYDGVKAISSDQQFQVLDLSPDQKFLYYYYVPMGERRLRVVNLATLKTVVDVRAPYGSSLGWSQNGAKMAYTEYETEDIENINVVDGDGQKRIKIGQGQQLDAIGWASDGHTLFYTEYDCHDVLHFSYQYYGPFCDTSIHVADINVQGNAIIYSWLLHSGVRFQASAVASNTMPRLIIPTPEKVVVFDYETRQEIESIPYPIKLQDSTYPKQPFWGGDGKLLLSVYNPYTKQGEIYEAVDGSFVIITDQVRLQEYDIFGQSYKDYYPLIYLGRDGQKQNIYIRDVNVQNPPEVSGQVIVISEITKKLELPGYKYLRSSWSPDNSEIALLLSKDEAHSIVVVYSLQDGKVWKVVSEPADYYNVIWSPDGQYLGFIFQFDQNTPALYVVRRTGEGLSKLTGTSDKELTGLFWVPYGEFLEP